MNFLRFANFRLEGKTAVITGAGQGMGRAFAEILVSNGAQVAVCDINLRTAQEVVCEIASAKGNAVAVGLDVSRPKSVSRMVDEVVNSLGYPDILINNAGVIRTSSFDRITDEEWRYVLDANLDGVFYCCERVVPLMVERRYGKIVNVSSTAGKTSSTFGGVHYTASKTAVLGITRHLARELAPFNINVNAVCPGTIDTPMIRGNVTPEQIRAGITKIPMGRLGRPEEVANLILFLVSDASSYITGASIDINGGELTI